MQVELDKGGRQAKPTSVTTLLSCRSTAFPSSTVSISALSTCNMDKLQQFDAWRIELLKSIPAKSTILNHNEAMLMVFQETVAQKWKLPLRLKCIQGSMTLLLRYSTIAARRQRGKYGSGSVIT
uniref:Uncharacterized protein n=1 Tax=Shewanella sp. (strain MR-7) TaxID=60481 RepID=Q0HR78_SHESR